MEHWEVEELSRQRKRALNDLRWHWEDAYEITWDGSKFRAARLDNGLVLADERADKLRELIIADYCKNPVPRRPD